MIKRLEPRVFLMLIVSLTEYFSLIISPNRGAQVFQLFFSRDPQKLLGAQVSKSCVHQGYFLRKSPSSIFGDSETV